MFYSTKSTKRPFGSEPEIAFTIQLDIRIALVPIVVTRNKYCIPSSNTYRGHDQRWARPYISCGKPEELVLDLDSLVLYDVHPVNRDYEAVVHTQLNTKIWIRSKIT